MNVSETLVRTLPCRILIRVAQGALNQANQAASEAKKKALKRSPPESKPR